MGGATQRHGNLPVVAEYKFHATHHCNGFVGFASIRFHHSIIYQIEESKNKIRVQLERDQGNSRLKETIFGKDSSSTDQFGCTVCGRKEGNTLGASQTRKYVFEVGRIGKKVANGPKGNVVVELWWRRIGDR